MVLTVGSGKPVPTETHPRVVLKGGASAPVLAGALSALHRAVLAQGSDEPLRAHALEGRAAIVAGTVVEAGVGHAVVLDHHVAVVAHVAPRALAHVVAEVGRDARGAVQARFRQARVVQRVCGINTIMYKI